MLEVGNDGRLPLGVFEERHKGAARDDAGGQARGLLLFFHASAIGALEFRVSPDSSDNPAFTRRDGIRLRDR